ncbi:MAG: hypothetical protein LBI45_07295 [Bacteroidales bacterium]|jgi:uncharacterized protein YlxW (UPF0749 family)|nr:hypothetical protein [Bacteroidales bacterium]
MTETQKTETYSCRLFPQTKKDLSELMASGDFQTQDQMFNTLLERYNNPMQINRGNQEKVTELQKEVIAIKEHYDSQIEKERQNHVKLVREYDELKKEMEDLTPVAGVPAGGTVLTLDPLNIQILNYVAIREGKKRKQEWTISDVVNFFIHSRFEIGSLNGDLSSVPDHIINQMRKELENV